MRGGGGESPTIVIILGESTQRGSLGIYGLPLDTTPNLAKLVRSGNLFVFRDIIAPASSTNAALEKVLSMSNYENASTPWFEQFSIIDLLKATNYHTAWISNQSDLSVYENVSIVVANNADTNEFSSFTGYDEVVLPILDSVKSHNTNPKQAYVIHLMGAHTGYGGRYPPNFSHFSIDDVDSVQRAYAPTPTEKAVKQTYLNAVRYNDFVVSSIIERFQDENAIIFYLSDHGEEVFDIMNFAGHSISNSPFAFEIPFLVYVSDSYKQTHKDNVERIANALNRPQMSDDFIHSFFDILGLKVEGLDSTRSIFSNHYNTNRKRLVYGIDYDSELKPKREFGETP